MAKRYRKSGKKAFRLSFFRVMRSAVLCALVLVVSFHMAPGRTFFDYVLWEVMAFYDIHDAHSLYEGSGEADDYSASYSLVERIVERLNDRNDNNDNAETNDSSGNGNNAQNGSGPNNGNSGNNGNGNNGNNGQNGNDSNTNPTDTNRPHTDLVRLATADDVITTYNSAPEPQRNLIGIDDIIFQDYDEFRPFVFDGPGQNFTISNIDLERFDRDRDFFISSFYNIDSNTGIIRDIFDPVRFLQTDLSVTRRPLVPQVLIFHTHGGTEFFVDSDTSDLRQGVIGTGERLKFILENKYGIGVIHVTDIFDVVDGVSARGGSYERMEPVIARVLAENPTIEVVLDLHRDGIEPNPHLVTYIDGRPHARLMFVNGVSTLEQGGEIRPLHNLRNDNLEKNLAFSFNMQLAGNEMFPGLMRRMLLKPFRYSTHMAGRSLLVEIGSQHSTMEEALNAMEPLADMIYAVVFAGGA